MDAVLGLDLVFHTPKVMVYNKKARVYGKVKL
jgi:hypothetical protein